MIEFGGNITIADIYKRVSDYDLFRYYCNDFKEVNVKFSSEFRTDPDPSAMIRVSSSGSLYYKDYGETDSYDPLDYVCRKFGINLSSALKKVDVDFNLGLFSSELSVTKKVFNPSPARKFVKQKTTIRYKSRGWNNLDKDFWLQFGIHKTTLERYGVKPISHFWLDKTIYQVACNFPAYVYIYYNDMYKIYQPYLKVGKWYSNNDISVVQGIKCLPKSGDLLIITSSLKDVMVLHEFGYHAIASIAESAFIPKDVFEKLKTRWRKIVLFLDNDFMKEDNPGKTNSIKFSEEHGLEYRLLPDNTQKDISDYRKHLGEYETDKILNELFYGI